MVEALEPLHEAIDSAQAVEDAIFEHIRNILAWKESIDSQLLCHGTSEQKFLLEDISQQAMVAITEHMGQAQNEFSAWRTKLTCDIMDMIQKENIQTSGISQELQAV